MSVLDQGLGIIQEREPYDHGSVQSSENVELSLKLFPRFIGEIACHRCHSNCLCISPVRHAKNLLVTCRSVDVDSKCCDRSFVDNIIFAARVRPSHECCAIDAQGQVHSRVPSKGRSIPDWESGEIGG